MYSACARHGARVEAAEGTQGGGAREGVGVKAKVTWARRGARGKGEASAEDEGGAFPQEEPFHSAEDEGGAGWWGGREQAWPRRRRGSELSHRTLLTGMRVMFIIRSVTVLITGWLVQPSESSHQYCVDVRTGES